MYLMALPKFKKSKKPSLSGLSRVSVKRWNISMTDDDRRMADELAARENRSVSNLLAVLVAREWQRLHPEAQVKEAA